jgi:hypothetical protein
MHKEILEGGHFAFRYDLGKFTRISQERILPIREIKSISTFLDIMVHQPGYGSDVGVPGPDCFVAVAIEARPLGKLTRLLAIPIKLAGHWRIGMILSIWDKLDNHKKCQTQNYNRDDDIPQFL